MQRFGRPISIKALLIFLLFAAPLVQYRVEMGIFSFALMEPVVLLVLTIWLIHQMMRGRLTILKDPLVLMFTAMAFWAFTVRPWAINWQNGLSDVRDWLIPLLGFVTLLTIRRGWRIWITTFLILVWLNAWLGIHQHIANGFRPFITELATYKTGFLISPETGHLMEASFAVGFFSHPNGFAMYLFAGLMIALGKLQENRRRKLLLFTLVVLPITLSLYWTYAKASLLVALGLIPLYWLNHRLKSTLAFLSTASAVLITGALILWSTIKYVPPEMLGTFWWRVGLWQIALNFLSNNLRILLFGNGLELFAQSAYYSQPHNLYLYLLLQYGLPGFSLILILAGFFWRLGLRLRKNSLMKANPILAALWFAVMGYFAIGLVESNLMGIESRMIFMTLAACFTGLAREVNAERIYQTKNAGIAYAEKSANISTI